MRRKRPTPSAKPSSQSAKAADLLDSLGNYQLLHASLDSKSALWRTLTIPFIRLLASLLRLWSRTWFGQRLGIRWAVNILVFSSREQRAHHEVSSAWHTYKSGNIKGPFR